MRGRFSKIFALGVRATQPPIEPPSGEPQVGLDGRLGNAQRFGNLLGRQFAEESKIDDGGFARMDGLEFLESRFEFHRIDVLFEQNLLEPWKRCWR